VLTYPVLRPFPCNSLLLQIADQKGGKGAGMWRSKPIAVERDWELCIQTLAAYYRGFLHKVRETTTETHANGARVSA